MGRYRQMDLARIPPARLNEMRATHPWLFDEQTYPFVESIGEDGGLRLARRPVMALPKEISPRIRRLARESEWRCFISGVQCYALRAKTAARVSGNLIPWAVSIEHLVSERTGLRALPHLMKRIQSAHNHRVVGKRLNATIGHHPMAIKLLIREACQTASLDRDDPSLENYYAVWRTMIEAVKAFKIDGNYLWQHSQAVDATLQRRARAFVDEMDRFDTEFLQMPCDEAASLIRTFVWRW